MDHNWHLEWDLFCFEGDLEPVLAHSCGDYVGVTQKGQYYCLGCKKVVPQEALDVALLTNAFILKLESDKNVSDMPPLEKKDKEQIRKHFEWVTQNAASE